MPPGIATSRFGKRKNMNYQEVAAEVLTAVGGKENVTRAMTCLTRLRLTLADMSKIDKASLRSIRGVLGTAARGTDGIEVVLGPAAIEGVSKEFSEQSGIDVSAPGSASAEPIVPNEPLDASKTNKVIITPGRRSSYRAQQKAALDEERLDGDDLDALRAFLDDGSKPKGAKAASNGPSTKKGPSVLVINGPNINMLGIREPNLYGKEDYAALVRTCKAAAAEAGFVDIKCFQSNHEGSIVDEIQAAFGTFDGIVMNPAAYTHTSVAILDAVKAVSLPCVEVHISRVEDREDFRQVSYVRQACFETITGMGIEGYRKAILDLAAHLGM